LRQQIRYGDVLSHLVSLPSRSGVNNISHNTGAALSQLAPPERVSGILKMNIARVKVPVQAMANQIMILADAAFFVSGERSIA